MIKSYATQRQSSCAEETSTRQGTREESLTTNFDTPAPEPIICKMKVPFVVLCLVVIYGTYRISADLIDTIDTDRDIIVSRHVPLEKSLSRQRRTLGLLISPITKLFPILEKSIKPILNLGISISEILAGKKECPKIEKLPIDVIKKLSLKPIETTQTILHYILNKIGDQGRNLVHILLNSFSQFIRYTALPRINSLLKSIRDIKWVPENIKAMIATFNTIYGACHLLGFVG